MLPLKQLKNKGLYAWMNNLLLVIALTACTPAVLQPGANRVMIINQSVASDCDFKGMASSNLTNQQGAFIQMQNQASQLGGNRIALIPNQEGNNLSSGNAFAGKIYYCP
ncbi:MAG: hypothetical protein A3E87_04270 [Gammaproteobacteria bacterium RIFCSPHIGHO2_12_FULL_35_23]|nr:MAG: hypothetical protein A3E87_04270 [Gammaproteobacteria bacterium RIFCSPHIGHO2_12_FULL_35_23]